MSKKSSFASSATCPRCRRPDIPLHKVDGGKGGRKFAPHRAREHEPTLCTMSGARYFQRADGRVEDVHVDDDVVADEDLAQDELTSVQRRNRAKARKLDAIASARAQRTIDDVAAAAAPPPSTRTSTTKALRKPTHGRGAICAPMPRELAREILAARARAAAEGKRLGVRALEKMFKKRASKSAIHRVLQDPERYGVAAATTSTRRTSS